MSQNSDYEVSNQAGQSVIDEINTILDDIASSNSGLAPPTGDHIRIGMLWLNENPNTFNGIVQYSLGVCIAVTDGVGTWVPIGRGDQELTGGANTFFLAPRGNRQLQPYDAEDTYVRVSDDIEQIAIDLGVGVETLLAGIPTNSVRTVRHGGLTYRVPHPAAGVVFNAITGVTPDPEDDTWEVYSYRNAGSLIYDNYTNEYYLAVESPGVWTETDRLPRATGAGFQPNSAGAGTRDAALFMSSAGAFTFDGVSWTEIGFLLRPTTDFANITTGTGTQSDAIALGFFFDDARGRQSFRFDGTSYTQIADLDSIRNNSRAVGTATSALVAGGTRGTTGLGLSDTLDTSALYNGTTWTTSASTLSSARISFAMSGDTSSASLVGGFITASTFPDITTNHETWNGTTWSVGTNFPLDNPNSVGSDNSGGTDNMLVFGGRLTFSANSQSYHFNGTAWSSRARRTPEDDSPAGAGVGSDVLTFGGGSSNARTSRYFSTQTVQTQRIVTNIT